MAFLPFSERAKQWEPIAIGLRHLAEVRDGDLLAPEGLASKVGLYLVDAHYALEDFSEADRRHILVTASDRWSGGVLPCPLPDGKCVCILNPNHPRRRNRITLMEEIVHMHRKHVPTGLREVLPGLRVRTYDAGQEAEAYGVGTAALLPWNSFFDCVNRGVSIEEIAETYDVTTQLAEYRIKITGATNLYRTRRRPSRMHNR